MALTADKPRTYGAGEINDLPVKGSTKIYEGSPVGDSSGYARNLASGDQFRGFALEQADNSSGSDGDITVRVRKRGLISLAVTSVAVTDVGRPVYASDNDTFALAGVGSYIGTVAAYVSSGVAIVAFDADKPERVHTMTVPCFAMTGIANGDFATNIPLNFNGRVKGFRWVQGVPVTTGSNLATINLEINTTNLTGGTIAMTSATCTPLGAVIEAAAITDGAGFKAGDTISIEASSVTAFVEGSGHFEIDFGQP